MPGQPTAWQLILIHRHTICHQHACGTYLVPRQAMMLDHNPTGLHTIISRWTSQKWTKCHVSNSTGCANHIGRLINASFSAPPRGILSTRGSCIGISKICMRQSTCQAMLGESPLPLQLPWSSLRISACLTAAVKHGWPSKFRIADDTNLPQALRAWPFFLLQSDDGRLTSASSSSLLLMSTQAG